MIKHIQLWLSLQFINLGIWVTGDDYIRSRLRMGIDLAGQMMQQEAAHQFAMELASPEDDDGFDDAYDEQFNVNSNGPTFH